VYVRAKRPERSALAAAKRSVSSRDPKQGRFGSKARRDEPEFEIDREPMSLRSISTARRKKASGAKMLGSGTLARARKKTGSSLAAAEAREAKALAELEAKVKRLARGKTKSGRSAVRKALGR
jgi:hypothetical protein